MTQMDGRADVAASDPTWLCDVNVLVALVLSTHVHHRAAHAALRQHTGGWATTPMTEAALVRLLLNPLVTGRAFGVTDVLAVLRGVRQDPRWRWLPDASTLADAAIDISVLTGHQQVTDLHLVNLAAVSGVRLATFDAAIPASLAPADRGHVEVLPQSGLQGRVVAPERPGALDRLGMWRGFHRHRLWPARASLRVSRAGHAPRHRSGRPTCRTSRESSRSTSSTT